MAAPLLLAALDEQPSFQRAQELYGELEFEQAIFELEQAALDEELSVEERARVLAWLGLCHAQVRREDESRRYFEMAVRQHADVSLPSFAPPAVVQALADVRAEVESSPAASSPTADPPEDEPAADLPANEPPSRRAAAPGSPPVGLATGVALGIVGGLTIVTGGVLLALAVPAAQQAQSEDAFQDDAIAAADVANAELATGGVLLGLGAVAGAGGAALALLWPE